jgi:hypothetical protein
MRSGPLARNVTEAEGVLFRASISESARWSLDATRIREEMGELWCTSHSRVSSVTTLRVTARTGSRQAA